MSVPYVLHRRATRPSRVWLTLVLIVFATLLAMVILPSPSGHDEVGERPVGVRPQSDTRPMPPPSVARLRGLAA